MNCDDVLGQEAALRADIDGWKLKIGLALKQLKKLQGWTYKCLECQGRTTAPYAPEVRREMLQKRLCFTCLFWLTHIEMGGNIVVEGEHYRVAKEKSLSRVIKWNDGSTLVTDCLWSQGRIPDRFRSRLADNAEFV